MLLRMVGNWEAGHLDMGHTLAKEVGQDKLKHLLAEEHKVA